MEQKGDNENSVTFQEAVKLSMVQSVPDYEQGVLHICPVPTFPTHKEKPKAVMCPTARVRFLENLCTTRKLVLESRGFV